MAIVLAKFAALVVFLLLALHPNVAVDLDLVVLLFAVLAFEVVHQHLLLSHHLTWVVVVNLS